MNRQTPQDMLLALSITLRKIDADPAPTPSLLELRRLLAERIERLEAMHGILAKA